MSILLVLFALLLVSVWRLRGQRVRVQFPPGPPPLPFIGNFHQINLKAPHETFFKWRQRYGPVFTAWIPKPCIVIASPETLHDALIRQSSEVVTVTSRLRDVGMGGTMMEQRIHAHIMTLIKHFDHDMQHGRATLDPHPYLAFCIGNIIHDIVMGHRYSFGDPEFNAFKKMLDFTLEKVASFQMMMIDTHPWLRVFLPLFFAYKRTGFALQKFFLRDIEEHEKNLSMDGEPRDFIEAYLREMRLQPDNPHYNKLTLALNSGDLWTGGMETTVTALRWGIAYLLHYPTVQEKMITEIDQVVGDRSVKNSDQKRMVYTCAVIAELLRIVNVLPWHIPHRTLRDCVLNGIFIPAGATIMPQFGVIHFDPEIFPEPYLFKPERHIDKNGELDVRKLHPFGTGKRACLGEQLARMELFLILTSLLQQYRFKTAPEGLPSLERSSGMTAVPKPYRCTVIRRRERPVHHSPRVQD